MTTQAVDEYLEALIAQTFHFNWTREIGWGQRSIEQPVLNGFEVLHNEETDDKVNLTIRLNNADKDLHVHGCMDFIHIDRDKVIVERRALRPGGKYWRKTPIHMWKWNDRYQRFDPWVKEARGTYHSKRYHWRPGKGMEVTPEGQSDLLFKIWAEKFDHMDLWDEGDQRPPWRMFYPMPNVQPRPVPAYRYPTLEDFIRLRIRRKLPKDVKKLIAQCLVDDPGKACFPWAVLKALPTDHWRDVLQVLARHERVGHFMDGTSTFFKLDPHMKWLLMQFSEKRRKTLIISGFTGAGSVGRFSIQYRDMLTYAQILHNEVEGERGQDDLARALRCRTWEDLHNAVVARNHGRLWGGFEGNKAFDKWCEKNALEPRNANEYTIFFPRNQADLNAWSDQFNNCVRGYAHRIMSGGDFIGIIKHGETNVACFQISADGKLQQYLGRYNQKVAEEHYEPGLQALCEARLTREVPTTGFWGSRTEAVIPPAFPVRALVAEPPNEAQRVWNEVDDLFDVF